MAKVITRLFDRREEALSAVTELESAGVAHDRISLIADNSNGDWRKDDDDNDAEDGTKKGATTGGLLGGGAGLLAGLGMLAIPGLGPVVAAGWLASTAAGVVAGALAGGAAGGLLGALKDAGHSEEDAHVYAEGVRRGGSLVSVKAESDAEAAMADEVLNGRGGVTAAQRGQDYRESGWNRFDEKAQPYSRDQIAAERSRYGEARTFREDVDPADAAGSPTYPDDSRPPANPI